MLGESATRNLVLFRHVYSLLFYLVLPAAIVRLLIRSRREPMYRFRLRERFGFCEPVTGPQPVWVHAVSAGETNAVAPLVERLLARGLPVMVTNMTPTGRARVQSLFGDRVSNAYAPYDVPGAVAQFLARVRPHTLVIVDTELWPNMIHAAGNRGIRILLVNGRLSERSARRYGRIPSLVGPMLAQIDVVACQTTAQGKRYVALGVPENHLQVTGSIKFDISLPGDLDDRVAAIGNKTGGRTLILAASTHQGEEQLVVEAFLARGRGDELLVLAPRHPHRADEVARLCERAGLSLVRHAAGVPVRADTQVLLLDTMGELIHFLAASKVAFIGGSLVPVGGHNPVEPAAVGVPFIMGPHLFNIDDIADAFVQSGAMLVVRSADELGLSIRRILDEDGLRESLVDNAARLLDANRGVLDRIEKLVLNT